MINVLIPLADGHYLSKRTLQGLAMQDVDLRVVPISRPIADNRRESEAVCRNLLRQFASDRYVAMIDSDVVFTSPTDISDCVRFLDENADWDVVALNTKGNWDDARLRQREDTGHVVIAATVWRTEVLRKIDFWDSPDMLECICRKVNRRVRIRYLDSRSLTEERRDV